VKRNKCWVERILNTSTPLPEMIGHFLRIKTLEYLMLPNCIKNFPEIRQVAEGIRFPKEVFKKQ